MATTTLPPNRAFAAVTDWEAHGRHVPLTLVRVVHGTEGVGTRFTARTGLGPLGFDDPMEVTCWEPPGEGTAGVCRIAKRGRQLRGDATIEVRADGTGAQVTWTERVSLGPRRLAVLTDRATAVPGRLLFGRVARRLLRDAERSEAARHGGAHG